MKTQRLAFILIAAAVIFGQIPAEMHFQGRFFDSGGEAYDGDIFVTFSIYDAETEGSLLWTETATETFTNGYMNHLIGSTTRLSPALFDGSTLFLELEFDGNTYDRSMMITVPYAVKSLHADSAGWAGYVHWDSIAGMPTDLDEDWNIEGDDLRSIPSGNVGIGTSPASGNRLHVQSEEGLGSKAVLGTYSTSGPQGWLGTQLYGAYGQFNSENYGALGTSGIGIYARGAIDAGYFEGNIEVTDHASIDGNVYLSSASQLVLDGDSGSDDVLMTDGSGNLFWGSPAYAGVSSLNGLTGDLLIDGGADISITEAGGTFTISYTGYSGGTDADWTIGSGVIYNETDNVGIGTTSPTTDLDIDGTIRIRGGTPGAGKVLTSDATGLASWETPSGGGTGDSDWSFISGSSISDPIYRTGDIAVGINDTRGHMFNAEIPVMSSPYLDHAAIHGALTTSGDGTVYGEGALAQKNVLSLDGYPVTADYIGVMGVIPASGGAGATNMAVYAWNNNNNSLGENYGVYSTANGAGGIYNYGVYADASGVDYNYGIYAKAPSGSLDRAGYFDGKVEITAALLDNTGSAGTSGDVLTSTGSGFTWSEPGGSGSDADWIIGSGVIYNESDNVGIGTTSPGYNLVVREYDATAVVNIRTDDGFSGGTGDVYTRYQLGSGGMSPGSYIWSTGIDNSDGQKFKISGAIDNAFPGLNDHVTVQGNGYVGIGTTSPTTDLDIDGTIRVRGGSPGAGKVLTSDATGLASWETPSSGGSDEDWFDDDADGEVYNYSDRIGIGTSDVAPSAQLEVASLERGVLFPRLTTEERDDILDPATGLLIFNTSTDCFNYYIEEQWLEICGQVTTGSRFIYRYDDGTPYEFTNSTLSMQTLLVKCWGGGGGGNGNSFSDQSFGGGGGFAMARIYLDPGETLYLEPAEGGGQGAGGGASVVEHSVDGIILIAAGGGGAGADGGSEGPLPANGGAGGGAVGESGGNQTTTGTYDYYVYGGAGGTQTAGGSGGTASSTRPGVSSCDGDDGFYLNGGTSHSLTSCTGNYAGGNRDEAGSGGSNGHGGSGGAGYYGGGAGGAVYTYRGGGGGGGSSYVRGWPYTREPHFTVGGESQIPGNMHDPDYQFSAGLGGYPCSDGKDGLIIIIVE